MTAPTPCDAEPTPTGRDATARDIAHRLLDGDMPRTIAGRWFSGWWWITTTGSLAIQDTSGATWHHDLDAVIDVGWPL